MLHLSTIEKLYYLYVTELHTKYIWIEDVFITGNFYEKNEPKLAVNNIYTQYYQVGILPMEQNIRHEDISSRMFNIYAHKNFDVPKSSKIKPMAILTAELTPRQREDKFKINIGQIYKSSKSQGY